MRDKTINEKYRIIANYLLTKNADELRAEIKEHFKFYSCIEGFYIDKMAKMYLNSNS